MSGLDDLVADAMKRKLIPIPESALTDEAKEDLTVLDKEVEQGIRPEPTAILVHPSGIKTNSTGGITPDVSLVFMVNGVRCILTVHVQAGATVAMVDAPPTTKAKAPRGGVKVKGIRGASTEESEAPEASEEVFDQSQPISEENLPEGWVADPVVGATIPDPEPIAPPASVWLCPDHAKGEERISTITGRTYTVCPDCGKLAPR